MRNSFDYIIVGAGIVGLTLARELLHREPNCHIRILEKESDIGLHGSGRNSGVLHSGIYYPEGSLKARMCSTGSKLMAEYCAVNNLPISRTGKVILPVKEGDERQLELLHSRARANGATVEIIDDAQLKQLEPSAFSIIGKSLFTPDTAVVEPKLILQSLVNELERRGVQFEFKCEITDVDVAKSSISTNQGKYNYGWLFNCAGQQADRVAKNFKVGERYTLMPFKGLYYKLSPHSQVSCQRLLYPVPDLNVPFLGVHYTRKINGDIYLGPTAIPALGREHYSGLKGIDMVESCKILYRLAQQYALNKQGFREFSHSEAIRFLKPKFVEAAQKLTPGLKSEDLLVSDKVGIRAQLLDKHKHELVMDFVVENAENSTHILNAISPAFTSSMSFAEYIIDQKLKVN